MPNNSSVPPYSPFYRSDPPDTRGGFPLQLGGKSGQKPPRRPDWLLILIGIFIFIVLVIIWFVDIPTFFR